MSQPLIVHEYGSVSSNGFTKYRPDQTALSRRQSLNGIELKASMVVTNNDTLLHLTDYR